MLDPKGRRDLRHRLPGMGAEADPDAVTTAGFPGLGPGPAMEGGLLQEGTGPMPSHDSGHHLADALLSVAGIENLRLSWAAVAP
jgi:hypothetical protein